MRIIYCVGALALLGGGNGASIGGTMPQDMRRHTESDLVKAASSRASSVGDGPTRFPPRDWSKAARLAASSSTSSPRKNADLSVGELGSGHSSTLGDEGPPDGNLAVVNGVATPASPFRSRHTPGSEKTVQVSPDDGTRSVEELSFDEVKSLLGFKDLDTGIIKAFLKQVKGMKAVGETKAPKTMFPDPEIGDLLNYFFNTGVLKDLAVLYAKAEADAKAAEAKGAKTAGGTPAPAKVISAVGAFKTQLKYVLDELKAGKEKFARGDSFDIKGDRVVILTRNIDYMIGALWFLQARPQFRSLTKEDDTNTSESMEIFEHMMNLVLKKGLPDNVGIKYDAFAKCGEPYEWAEETKRGKMTSFFLGNKKTVNSAVKAGIYGLIPSLMAYEAWRRRIAAG